MMQRKYARLAQRLFNTPLALSPQKLETILVAIGPRMHLDVSGLTAEVEDPADVEAEEGSLTVVGDLAVIDVTGTLVNRSSWMNAYSGLTSYESIRRDLRASLDDANVKQILLNIDSPGGECEGLFDLADELYAARSIKPITALANETACSAAALLATCANQVYLTQSAIVGSVGVVMARLDVSQANERVGVRVEHFHGGARKVDRNPDVPVSDEERSALQAHIDQFYGLIASKVARNRGLTEEAVRGQEAGVFIGASAVGIGMADGVTTVDELMTSLTASAGHRPTAVPNQPEGVAAMPTKCPVKAGTNLAGVLNDSIENTVSEETPREAVIDQMAEAAGTDAATVEQVLSGELNCPELDQLQGFASVLGDVTTEQLVAAAMEDGCEYEMEAEEGEEEAPPAEEGASSEARTVPPKPAGKGARMSETSKLQAKLDLANARIAESERLAKAKVIETHEAAGRVVPALRAVVDRAAETLTAEELDAELSKWPSVTHSEASGQIDGKPGPSEGDKKISRALGISTDLLATWGDVRGIRADGRVLMADGTTRDKKAMKGVA